MKAHTILRSGRHSDARVTGFWLGCLLLFLSACQTAEVAATAEETLELPFNLTTFIKENLIDDKNHEVTFQILDRQGLPVSFGLLKLEWPESDGRMSFQTDEQGALSMHFDEDMLKTEVLVSADIKPQGQVLLEEEDYDLVTKPLPGGRIRATW